MQTLKERTCVMAGAAQGDGRETAKALCACGMNVAIVTQQPPMAESLIEEIREAGRGRRRIWQRRCASSPVRRAALSRVRFWLWTAECLSAHNAGTNSCNILNQEESHYDD